MIKSIISNYQKLLFYNHCVNYTKIIRKYNTINYCTFIKKIQISINHRFIFGLIITTHLLLFHQILFQEAQIFYLGQKHSN